MHGLHQTRADPLRAGRLNTRNLFVTSNSDEGVSKTQLKKQMIELQQLGESLIELTPKQYASVPMPDALRDAVDAARAMTKRGALHRQRQFIGRVMRDIDPEPIRKALDRIRNQDRDAARQFHRVEALRARLIDSEGDREITSLMREHPEIDAQALRQKLRAARREAETGKPRGAQRALFRFLDALVREADEP